MLHLGSGLRVPAKLVGDATQLAGGGGGGGGGGRAGEAEVVVQGVREEAGAETQLVLASGLHFPAGGAVDWRVEGRVLVAGGARSLALAEKPADLPTDKHAVHRLAPALSPSLVPALTPDPEPKPRPEGRWLSSRASQAANPNPNPNPDPKQVATLEGEQGSWGVEWGATQPPRFVVKPGKARRRRRSAMARSSLWWRPLVAGPSRLSACCLAQG